MRSYIYILSIGPLNAKFPSNMNSSGSWYLPAEMRRTSVRCRCTGPWAPRRVSYSPRFRDIYGISRVLHCYIIYIYIHIYICIWVNYNDLTVLPHVKSWFRFGKSSPSMAIIIIQVVVKYDGQTTHIYIYIIPLIFQSLTIINHRLII